MKINKTLILKILLAVIVFSLLVFFSCQCLKSKTSTEATSSVFANFNADIIKKIFGVTIVRDENYYVFIRKLYGHYLFFVVLGIFSWLFYYFDFNNLSFIKRMILHFSTGFIFALFSEFVLEQIAVNRNANFSDVLIDYAGFITVSLIITIIVLIIKIKKKEKICF